MRFVMLAAFIACVFLTRSADARNRGSRPAAASKTKTAKAPKKAKKAVAKKSGRTKTKRAVADEVAVVDDDTAKKPAKKPATKKPAHEDDDAGPSRSDERKPIVTNPGRTVHQATDNEEPTARPKKKA